MNDAKTVPIKRNAKTAKLSQSIFCNKHEEIIKDNVKTPLKKAICPFKILKKEHPITGRPFPV